jgi:hypothetical protein
MVTRRHAREVFADLSPDELYWIEFWGTGREVVYLQTGMLSYEDLNFLALMNRMVIPKQHDRATHTPEHLSQKRDDLLTREGVTIALDRQLQPATARCHLQGPKQIETLAMPQTRAYSRGLPTRCPRAFKERDQGEAAFIFKHPGSPLLTPLFLSAARPCVSIVRRRGHHGRGTVGAVAGNSNLAAAAYAIPYWG